jgi:hypothetical protein
VNSKKTLSVGREFLNLQMEIYTKGHEIKIRSMEGVYSPGLIVGNMMESTKIIRNMGRGIFIMRMDLCIEGNGNLVK